MREHRDPAADMTLLMADVKGKKGVV